MQTYLRALAALAILAAAWPAAAQQQANPLVTELEARKVVRGADGKESFAAADSAKPGDVIEYVATYRNTGKQPLRNLQATLPIPHNTEFVPGTANPANANASIDAKSYAAMPLKRLHTGHGPDITGHAQLVARRLADHERRCERIVGALTGGNATAYGIAAELWPQKMILEQPLLVVWEVLGHLDLLLDAGRVREQVTEDGSTHGVASFAFAGKRVGSQSLGGGRPARAS